MKRLIIGLALLNGIIGPVGVIPAARADDFYCLCDHEVSWYPDGSYPIHVELTVSPGDPCKEVLPESATVVVLDGGVHYCQ